MQVVNRELILPETGERLPKQEFETGKLTYGITDPKHEEYNSLGDFYECNNVVEIRIPWLLLNVSDPSSKEIVSNLQANESITFEQVSGIHLGISNQDNSDVILMNPFQWHEWNEVKYEVRLKKSYSILQKRFAGYQKHDSKDSESFTPSRTSRIRYVKVLDHWYHLTLPKHILILFGTMSVYLLVYLFGMNYRNKRRNTTSQREKEKIMSYLEGVNQRPENINKKYLYSMDGIHLLNEISEEVEEAQKKNLHYLLLNMGYIDYIEKMISSKNTDVMIPVIKLLGDMRSQEYAKDIVACMYHNPNHQDLQYNGLLALSLMGCQEELIQVCLDASYPKNISFRCFIEIIEQYSGDTKELCAKFLKASDNYVQRIGIQLIGENQYMEMEEQLVAFLEHTNLNLRCDAIRALGALKSKRAASQLIEMTSGQEWEVVNVVYAALGSIGLEEYLHVIKQGLYSSEWWVRYNTATLLASSPKLPEIYQEVMDGTDQFAKEILQYTRKIELLKRGNVHEYE